MLVLRLSKLHLKAEAIWVAGVSSPAKVPTMVAEPAVTAVLLRAKVTEPATKSSLMMLVLIARVLIEAYLTVTLYIPVWHLSNPPVSKVRRLVVKIPVKSPMSEFVASTLNLWIFIRFLDKLGQG